MVSGSLCLFAHASLPFIMKPLPSAEQTLASCSLTPELQAQTLLLCKLDTLRGSVTTENRQNV